MKMDPFRISGEHPCKTHPLLILLLFFIGFNNYMAQQAIQPNNITLRKGEKHINLKKYNEFIIVFNKTSQGMDSVSTEIFAKEIKTIKDTICVKPTDITTYRFMDTLRPYSESRYYPPTTNTWLKIPMREIDFIKAKKQPLNKVCSTLLITSYVALLCSPFVFMSQNPEISNFGAALFVASVPVMVISFTGNSIWGKKNFYFDSKRTHKKVWEVYE